VFDGLYSTTLEADELVTWVRVPKLELPVLAGFAETSPRHGDFADAACAVVAEVHDDVLTRLRAVLVGVADRPIVCISRNGIDLSISQRQIWHELWDSVVSDGVLREVDDQVLELASVVFVRACIDAVGCNSLRSKVDERR